jgi:HAMP domain-containing protein
MDIRTRLALSLVSVCLLSMALLGAFAYYTAEGLLQDTTIRQLDALAEGKKRDLIKVQEGWHDRVELMKQRVISFSQRGVPTSDNKLTNDLNQILAAVENVSALRVLDGLGQTVGKAGLFPEGYISPKTTSPERVKYLGTFFSNETGIQVVYSTDLVIAPWGSVMMEVVVNAKALQSVTNDYTGLGETGESMIIKSEDDKTILVLNEVRHVIDEKPSMHIPKSDASDFMTQTLAQTPGIFIEGAYDYRGTEVWVATRFLENLGWGIIVKVDAEEERERSVQLRSSMMDIGIALSAFAIIGGTLLGLYLARPIHNLAELVQRIRLGESDLRAEVIGDDEIAYLSESLNELLDHVQEKDQVESKQSEQSE